MDNIKFAINMELDGEKYYREQAEINRNNRLYTVCLLLAEEEKSHAQILTDYLNKRSNRLVEADTLSKTENIFDGLDDIQFEGAERASQLDFYRIAAEKEKESIELYKKYALKAEDGQEKELFEFLMKQEEMHFNLLDELNTLLMHAEEWVENAEFGIREKY
ncbi:MAG TPA: ferritin family protein [Bacillota bacterium]|nr:ferritin family protein [Bacillota bacterium]